jgi:hypothetical protein
MLEITDFKKKPESLPQIVAIFRCLSFNHIKMKKILTICLALTLYQAMVCGQSCLPEGITFESQDQIDNFHFNYPGCTQIEGDVYIHGIQITNLQGLDGITSIGGDLSIYVTLIPNLAGLNELTDIGGSLRINQCRRVTSMAALGELDSIGGSFDLYYSDTLTSLQGLENLTYVGDTLSIQHCDTLQEISAVSNLNTVGGLLLIHYNKALTTLDGLNGLDSVGGNIFIFNNDSLMDISFLENFDTIHGSLSIGNNDILPNLHGLEHIKSINGGLYIANDDMLVTLAGLDSLKYIGEYLTIGDTYTGGNESIVSLAGLNNLKSVGTHLMISRNPYLVNLTALMGLETIGGDIDMYHNIGLTSLSGLDNINYKTIVNLNITNNSNLSNCAVESICMYIDEPNGIIDIHDNATGCTTEEEVDESCGSLFIPELTDLKFAVMPNPSSGRFIFYFESLPHPVRLEIMTNVGQVVGKFHIGNERLTDQGVVWDATVMPPGIYFYRILDERVIAAGKLLLQ